jgi:hypothetical protein
MLSLILSLLKFTAEFDHMRFALSRNSNSPDTATVNSTDREEDKRASDMESVVRLIE